MGVMIIYDSAYGNTEKIAQAVGAALSSEAAVTILRVGEVKANQVPGSSLLIVGSPTQRFRPTVAISSLLKDIPKDSLKGVRVAAFDTRLTQSHIDAIPILAFFVRIFGYAAKPIADRLRKKGGELVASPQGFFVDGMEGPLSPGELEHAALWAKQLLAGV